MITVSNRKQLMYW